MEVHHHPELHHKRKKLKEYFLEFLMIFLAVTMGFFAESLRENISDKEKEKEYISSFIKNLEDDTAHLKIVINENTQIKLSNLHRLLSLSSINLTNPVNRRLFYKYAVYMGFYSEFKSNDATMLQLKNSGGLRFVRKEHVADSIAKYDIEMKIIYSSENLYTTATDLGILANQEVLDFTIFHDSTYYSNGVFTNKFIPLITNDPQKIKLLFNKVDYEIGATQNYINNMQQRLPFAVNLISYLKKQYKIE